MPILTTITAYWNRPKMLHAWVKAMKGAMHPDVVHHVFFVGESIDPIVTKAGMMATGVGMQKGEQRPSIGHIHNIAATLVSTPWMMKLDVDAFPHIGFFGSLLPVLAQAKEREWFNAGMFYLNQQSSETFLTPTALPLETDTYLDIVRHLDRYSASSYHWPAASNFVCRTADYQATGGCSPKFRGWGWEDYQQLYALERLHRGSDPLPGTISIHSVTNRCRDEISRPKARELYLKEPVLALLHHWHPSTHDHFYKSQQQSDANRATLFQYINHARARAN
jgi:hypothetical protein